jgi:IclR family pca regulon transcriptional regulator
MNVTVHAAETTVERLTGEYLPLLLRTAGDVSADWALWQSRPYSEVRYDEPEESSFGPPGSPAGLERG